MKKKEDFLDVFPCQLPEIKLSCYGCCGRDFKKKSLIERDISINTKEFKKIKVPSTLRLLQFRDRLDSNPDILTPSGICSNLVDFGDSCIACPLHPKINNILSKKKFLAIHKKDLRINHCDVNYECETIIFWKEFDNKKKQKYINFIKNKKLNNYDYSVKNLKGELIREFLDFK